MSSSQQTCEEETDLICEVSPLVSYAGEVSLNTIDLFQLHRKFMELVYAFLNKLMFGYMYVTGEVRSA